MTSKKRDIVIAGYSETAIDFKTGRSAFDLGGEALAKLLAATGISKDVVLPLRFFLHDSPFVSGPRSLNSR